MKPRNIKIKEGKVKLLALPAKDFASQFGKPAHWIRRLANQGRVKCIREFGEMLIPMTEVDVIMDSLQEEVLERSWDESC
ncbi:hypothetical protein N8631_00245 [Verrucomicrobiales bacterium]|jgi:hypothetical protein|nr:hypothetical protein [Verrucomicrobiales bacterium]